VHGHVSVPLGGRDVFAYGREPEVLLHLAPRSLALASRGGLLDQAMTSEKPQMVVVLGAVPAGLAMAATAWTQRAALLQLVSATTVPVPWPDIIGVTALCLLVAAATSAAAAARLTATTPIELAGQRE